MNDVSAMIGAAGCTRLVKNTPEMFLKSDDSLQLGTDGDASEDYPVYKIDVISLSILRGTLARDKRLLQL